MESLRTVLEQQPLMALFLTIAIGYLAGEMVNSAEVLAPRLQADAIVMVVRPASFGLDRDEQVLLPGFFGARFVAADDGAPRLERLGGPNVFLRRVPALKLLKERSALLDVGFGRAFLWLHKEEGAGGPLTWDGTMLARRVGFAVDRLRALVDSPRG